MHAAPERSGARGLVRIEVKSRADVLAGKAFGTSGPYEKMAGTIYFAVDPRNDVNTIITDIDKAPRNAAGKAEFSSDFYLLKPKDVSRGNGTVLYEVSNRGGKGMIGFFNRRPGSLEPETTDQLATGFCWSRVSPSCRWDGNSIRRCGTGWCACLPRSRTRRTDG
jgi:hypothetical protein